MKQLIALGGGAGPGVGPGVGGLLEGGGGAGRGVLDGSPYRFYVSPGDPKKVVLDFQGGGACWDAATCGPESRAYRKRVDVQELLLAQGIYNRMSVANPFLAREWAAEAQRAVLTPAQAENYTFYLAPGSQHCILPRPELYTLKVGEVSFLDWLKALAEGKVAPRVRP
jgi:hypothetical protein